MLNHPREGLGDHEQLTGELFGLGAGDELDGLPLAVLDLTLPNLETTLETSEVYDYIGLDK